MRRLACALAFLAVATTLARAQNQIALSEIVASWQGNDDAQLVELTMLADGQQQLANVAELVFDDATGSAGTRRFFVLTKSMARSARGVTVLFMTGAMTTVTGITPDFVLPDGSLSRDGGRVCYATLDQQGTAQPIDCVAWGTYAGDTLGYGRPVVATPVNRALVRRATSGVNRDDWTAVLQPTPQNNAGQGVTLPTLCGNGQVDQGEACDGENLGGQTCASLGFAKGKLACDQCQLDSSKCTFCGNGAINGKEECDGTDLGDATCERLGFTGGTLACTRKCLLTTEGCDATFFVPGGGPPKPDCQLEWRVQNAAGRPGATGAAPPRLKCRDGDVGCDVGDTAGSCTVAVALCFGRSDARLPKCTAQPTASVTVTTKPATDPAAAALLAAAGTLGASTTAGSTVTFAPPLDGTICTDPVQLVVPVRKKLLLRAKTMPARGTRDADVLRVACTP